MKNKQLMISALVVVVVAVAAFFGGMKYQQSNGMASAQTFDNRQITFRGGFARGARAGGVNGLAVVGKIVSVDNGSITIQMKNGSSKIVILPGSTTISKTATASASDLQDGVNVAIFGTTNSDGSVTAQDVQINPQLRASERRSPVPVQ